MRFGSSAPKPGPAGVVPNSVGRDVVAVVRFADAVNGGVYARVTLWVSGQCIWEHEVVGRDRRSATLMAATRAEYEAARNGYGRVRAWDMPGCPSELPSVEDFTEERTGLRRLHASRERTPG